MTQSIEAEIRTEVALDNGCSENSLPGIAQREDDSAPENPVTQQVGRDGCADRAGYHRQSRSGPKRNQDAGRNTGGGPEYGHAIRFGQQNKAQPRGQKIRDADRDGEPIKPNHRCVRSAATGIRLGSRSCLKQVVHPIVSLHVTGLYDAGEPRVECYGAPRHALPAEIIAA